MTEFYADSSVLVKRHVGETGDLLLASGLPALTSLSADARLLAAAQAADLAVDDPNAHP